VEVPSGFTDPVRWLGKEDHVLLSLMVAFGVVMRDIILLAMMPVLHAVSRFLVVLD
jgi:hypothetical protein